MTEHFNVEVTQYLRPHDTKKLIYKEVPEHVYDKALSIIDAGYHLEAEVLTTGEVSFTVVDREQGVDVAIRLSPNGPEVHEAFNDLILSFKVPTEPDEAA